MSTFISNEEKRQILVSLRSAVPATRFLMLKKLAEIADTEPDKIRTLEAQDEYTFSDIITAITYLKEQDRDEVIRREAAITLEKIKAVLEPKHIIPITKCDSCGALVDIGWEFCSKCGVEIKKSIFNLPKCTKCGNYIKDSWIFCTHCGYRLKNRLEKPKCPNCRRIVDESWIMCPFCGYKLKTI